MTDRAANAASQKETRDEVTLLSVVAAALRVK